MVADGHHPDHVPLTERRRLDAGARQFTAAAVVVVQPEVALERIGSDDVVLAVVEPKHDAARGILLPGQRIEFHRNVYIGERSGWRHDHVELILGRTLHQNPLANRRAGHVLHDPLTVYRRPALDALGLEVDAIGGNVFWQLEFHWRGARARGPADTIRAERRQRGSEETPS